MRRMSLVAAVRQLQWGSGRAGLGAGAVGAAVVLLAVSSVGFAAPPRDHLDLSSVRGLRGTATLDSRLVSVSATARSAGAAAAVALARAHALTVVRGAVQVEIVARDAVAARAAVRDAGGTVQGAI